MVDEWGIQKKVEGLAGGKFGYELDPAAAREFNDQLAENGNVNAIHRQIDGVCENWYGYKGIHGNYIDIKKLNDSLADSGDVRAIKRRINHSNNGGSASDYDQTFCLKYVNGLLKQGNPLGLEAFLLAEDYDRVLPKFIPQINRLIKAKNRLGLYFEAFGMLEGLFGYEKDEEQAKKNILKHHLAL